MRSCVTTVEVLRLSALDRGQDPEIDVKEIAGSTRVLEFLYARQRRPATQVA